MSAILHRQIKTGWRQDAGLYGIGSDLTYDIFCKVRKLGDLSIAPQALPRASRRERNFEQNACYKPMQNIIWALSGNDHPSRSPCSLRAHPEASFVPLVYACILHRYVRSRQQEPLRGVMPSDPGRICGWNEHDYAMLLELKITDITQW